MERIEQKEIRLVVRDEQILYTPLSPEAEFGFRTKEYIRSKAAIEKPGQSIKLTVISHETLDEERFREAVSNWSKSEMTLFRRKEREMIRILMGSLAFGSILLILSLALQQRFEVLKYSLLPILGSLALSKAAGILITDMPILRAQRWMLNEMEKKNVIKFEYIHEENTYPDKELV